MTEPEGSPYLGLSSYREDDAARFFGREDETRELERLVRRSRVTVLFGRSGLGKSSLLHAGLFPAVRGELLPIVVRMDLADDKKPILGSLRDDIAEQARLHHVEVELAEPGERATLQELFRSAYFWSQHHKLLVPLLVLDRFEELFTLGKQRRDRAVQGFVRELAELADPRERTARPDDADAATAAPRPLILLALREDFLADLEDLKSELPTIMRSRYRLRPMTGRRALDAVLKPARGRLSAAVAEDVVRFVTADTAARTAKLDLADLEVEPALLSVVCDQLYKRRRPGGGEITQTLTRTERNEIIDIFYKDSFKGIPEADKLRELVENQLVNEQGFRTAIDVPHAVSQYGVTTESIEELERRRLVRIERRFNAPHVELIHDLVLRPVIASRAKRQEQRAIEARSRRRGKLAGAISAVVVLAAIGVSYGTARRSAAAAQEVQRTTFRTLLVEQGREALLRDEFPTALQLLDTARTFAPEDTAPDPVAQIMLGRAVSSLAGVRQSVQHGPEVECVRLARDADRLLTCASDGTARSWALADRIGAPMPVPAFGGGVSSKPPLLIPSHAGDWVLAVGADGSAERVDVRGHAPAPNAPGEEVAATRASSGWQGCISPDDGGFAIWSPGKPGSLHAWRVGPAAISAIAIKATPAAGPIEVVCLDRGSVLALMSSPERGEVLRLESSDGSMTSLTGLQLERIEHIAASPDGGVVVATQFASPRILVWRTAEMKRFLGPVDPDQIAIAGGHLLVTTNRARARAEPGLTIPRRPGATSVQVVPTHGSAEKPSDLATPWNRAAEILDSVGDDDVALVTVWDLKTLHLLFSVERRGAKARLVQDGGVLAIRSNHQIELWDTATWRPLLMRTIEGRAGAEPFDIARDRTGGHVVAVVDGPIVRIFEPVRGSRTERRVGHAPELFGAWPLGSSFPAGSLFSADQTWVRLGGVDLVLNLETRKASEIARTDGSGPDAETLSTWLGHSGVVVAIGGRICFKPVLLGGAGPRQMSCVGNARTPAAALLVAHPAEPKKVLVVRNTGSAEWVSFTGSAPSSVPLALPAGGAPVAASFVGPQHHLVIARDDGNLIEVDGDGAVKQLPPAIPDVTSIRGSLAGALVIAHHGGVEILEPDGARHHIDTEARDAVLADLPAPLLWACGNTGCTAWDPKTLVMLGAVQTSTPEPRLSSDGRFVTARNQLLLLPVPPRGADPVLRASAVTAGSLSGAGDVVARNASGENELATGSAPQRLAPSDGALAPPSFGADRTLVVPSGRVVKLGVAGRALQDVWTAASSIVALRWNRERSRFVAVDAEFGVAIIDGRQGNVVAQAPDTAPRPVGRLATFDPSGDRFAMLVPAGAIEVHRTDTGALLGSYPGGGAVQRIELAGDSVLGVIADGLLVWARPGTAPARLSGSFDELRLAPDGVHLVARRNGHALIWTLPLDPGAEPKQLAADAFDIDSTGKRLLVSVARGQTNTETTVHPLDNQLLETVYDQWTEATTSAVFAPGGSYVLMPEAHIIHGVLSHEIRLPAPVRAYAFGGDGRYAVVFDAQGSLLYRPFDPDEVTVRRWISPGAATLSRGPSALDGRSALRVSTPTGESLWIFGGIVSLSPRKLALPGHQQLRFDVDPDVVWSLADNGVVTKWDVRTGHPTVRKASVVAAALTVDTARVVVASETFALELRELGDARDASARSSPLRTSSTSAISIAAIEPTARWLVTGRDDGTVESFDLASPARAPLGLRTTASPAPPSAIAVAMTDGSPTAAIGRRDGTVDLWRLDGRELTVQLAGHSGQILSAAFDDSGAWLATASSDGTVRVWDARNGHCITRLTPRVDHAAVALVAFGPGDEPGLLSASEFGDLSVWDLFVPVPSGPELQALLSAWQPLSGGLPRSP